METLFNLQKNGWDEDLLADIFNEDDAASIMNIPIAESKPADKIIWVEDEKGKYTVRSCYKKLQGELQNTVSPTWTMMWNFKLPPKVKTFFWQVCTNSLPTTDLLRLKQVPVPPLCQMCNIENESAYHLFAQCELARLCWERMGGVTYRNCNSLHEWVETNFNHLNEIARNQFVMVCWKLWDARNEKVWNQRIIPHYIIVEEATVFLHNWTAANSREPGTIRNEDQHEKWTKPPIGWTKVNVDTTLDINGRKMGFGCVMRDSYGNFIAARELPWHGLFKPGEAEAIGVREALKWIKEMKLDHVQVETNCLQVIKGIQNQPMVSSFDLIINDIEEIARDFSNLCFLFSKRSANKAAHMLAREALFKSDLRITFPFLLFRLIMYCSLT